MTRVLSATVVQYERGAKMFRDGKPCPPKPSDDATGFEPESLLWIGYRVAKALDFDRRRKVAGQLNMPEPEWNE